MNIYLDYLKHWGTRELPCLSPTQSLPVLNTNKEHSVHDIIECTDITEWKYFKT